MRPKIGGSTYCKRDLQTELQNLKASGYDFAELDLGLPLKPNEEFESRLKKAKNIIPILAGHLPEIDFRKEEIERCKRFIEILSAQNANLFVIHLFSRNLATGRNLGLKIRGLKELAAFAGDNDSLLLLENTEEDVEVLKAIFDEIPEMGFCLDVGHANLFAKENRSINLIKHFGKILRHIHLHDNAGGDDEKSDLHLPIGSGRVDFAPIFGVLKKMKYSGNVTLEIFSPDKEYRKMSIERIRKLIQGEQTTDLSR